MFSNWNLMALIKTVVIAGRQPIRAIQHTRRRGEN